MEVILLERVEKLGRIGDVVTVKDGYARNFLIPRSKALRATNENKAEFEAQRKEIEAQNDVRKKDAESLFSKVDGLVVVLIRQAGEDGRLFGSVTARDIANEIAKKISDINHRHVNIGQPIKYTGIYNVKLSLHAEVIATVRVNVARTESEAKEALTAEKTGKKKEAKSDDVADAAEEVAAEAPVAEVANDVEAA